MQQMEENDPRRRLGFRLRLLLARGIVTFERAYPAFWPAFAVVVAFVVAAWLDLFAHLPTVLHILVLALFASAFLVMLWRGWRSWRAASADEALRRLERDSGLKHQALRALSDDLPALETHDPATLALWRAHRQRLIQSLGKVRLAWPRSPMPARDPMGYRALAVLFLVIGLVGAQGDYWARIEGALLPWRASHEPQLDPEASLWITPPAYTRRPPLLAEQTRGLAALDVPVGSEVLLQVHHLSASALEALRVTLGDQVLTTARLGDGSVEWRQPLDRSGRLAIALGQVAPIKAWDLKVIADAPPTIAFDGKPIATARGVTHLQYEANDDYGLVDIELEMQPPEDGGTIEHFPLARLSAQPQHAKNAAYLDLTAHPRAGLPVRLTLKATDGKGQSGLSPTMDVVLPERPFHHPLARAVIALRKMLVADPKRAEEVAAALSNLGSSDLAQSLGAGVTLSLHVAGRRVVEATEPEQRTAAVEMLWDLALFIEDGGLSNAEKEMRALQEKLQQSIDQGADDKELSELMEQLQGAMDRYLDELEKKAAQQARNMTPEQRQQLEAMRQQSGVQTLDRQDLQDMLDQARQMMRGGAKDQARQTLSRLQEMLENLQAQGGDPQPPSEQEKSLSDLQKMGKLQQRLLERSFDMMRRENEAPPDMGNEEGMDGEQQGQEGQRQPAPGQNGPPSDGQQMGQGGKSGKDGQAGQSAGEQEGLRRALGELMRRMGEQGMEIPRALGQAEMQMREARDALQQGRTDEAAQAQTQALDLMQQGGQAMMEQMQKQAGGQPGQGTQQGGMPMVPGRQGRDPLGRAQYNNGGTDPQGASVPDNNGLGSAREVLEQLYRRSGERARPADELDYYKRLLDRF